MRISRRNKRTRVGVAAALVLTSGIAAVAADWPQLRGDTQRTGVAAEAIKPPLAVQWRFTGGAQGNNLTSPVIVGNTVYYTTRASAQQGGRSLCPRYPHRITKVGFPQRCQWHPWRRTLHHDSNL